MKQFKFCVLTLFSLLILSCQKEELNTSEIQDLQLKQLTIPENFKNPKGTLKMSSQEEKFTWYNTEPYTYDCNLNSYEFNNVYGVSIILSNKSDYFSGYFSNSNGEGTIITVLSSSNSVIYEEIINSGEEIFRAISNETDAYIKVQIFSSTPTYTLSIQGKYGNCELNRDTDGDGCLDENDSIPNSNMEETIVLQDCDSQVENRVTSECGVMMSDLIDKLENGTYRNHGSFVKEVVNLTETWFLAGLITVEEKDALVSCAAQSK